MHIVSRYESFVINNAEIIIAVMVISFAMGFIVCIKPFLSLKSSI